MNDQNSAFGDDAERAQTELAEKVSFALLDRIEKIAADTVAVCPFTGAEALDTDYCSRLGQLLVHLLAFAVHNGGIDPRGEFVADLYRIVIERALSIQQLFSFAYLNERTALDDLAVHQTLGATSASWPLVGQIVRRGSFDLLAAYTERARLEPTDAGITDKLTTLHTRPLFDVVLANELERAGRFGFPISLVLFDVDRMSHINKEHGYGVGDKILERLGILVRTYFRQHDWVARHSEDSMAVLLSRGDAEHAGDLAERLRATVEERLGFIDHRTDTPVVVTLTAAVINVQPSPGHFVDPEQLLGDAEAAVERGKQLGRNRVERVHAYSATRTLPHSSPSA
jgi:diguanylate cyclase (GGDEF)-like protein